MSRRLRAVIAALCVAAAVLLVRLDHSSQGQRQPQGRSQEQARASDVARYHGKTFTVVNVVDGDTIDVDAPDGEYEHTRIRLWGVDTPETNIACEKARALAAKAFTEAWINRNSPVVISSVKPDKFGGRYVAVVTGAGGERLSAALIQSGHGRVYNGGARQSWCP